MSVFVHAGALCVEMGFTWTSQGNQDVTMKLKSELISNKFQQLALANPKLIWKLSLGYHLSTFGSYSYFQTSF